MKEYTNNIQKNTNVTVTIQERKSIYLFITLMKKNSFLFSVYLDSSFLSTINKDLFLIEGFF